MQRWGRDRTPTISTPMWKGEEWETHGRHWSTATLNSHWVGAEGALLTKDPCSVPCSPWPFAPLLGLLFPLSFLAACKRALKDFLSLGERAYFPDCFLAVEYVGPRFAITVSFGPDWRFFGKYSAQKHSKFYLTPVSSTCQQTFPQFA